MISLPKIEIAFECNQAVLGLSMVKGTDISDIKQYLSSILSPPVASRLNPGRGRPGYFCQKHHVFIHRESGVTSRIAEFTPARFVSVIRQRLRAASGTRRGECAGHPLRDVTNGFRWSIFAVVNSPKARYTESQPKQNVLGRNGADDYAERTIAGTEVKA